MPHFLLSSLKSWWSPKIPQIIRQVIFKKTLIILHIILHIFYAGINSSMVLKSEQQVMKAKKSNRKKPLISKSKLGNSFSLLRENITDHCSVDVRRFLEGHFHSCQETSTVCLLETKQKKQLGNLLTSLYYVRLTIPLKTCLSLCYVSFYYC